MKKWTLIGLSAGLAILLAGCKATRAGYESPKYKVLGKDGAFEIRDYPGMTWVTTPMAGSERGMNGGFGRLFGYITGRNQRSEKIAMTTPVFISPGENAEQMSFVLPKNVAEKGAPPPAGTNVVVNSVAAGRFAVLRFDGSRTGQQPQKAAQRLLVWARTHNLKAVSPPQFAYYDPPWIPWFLRRNEVHVKVEAEQP